MIRMALRADGKSYVFAAHNFNFNAAQLAAVDKTGAGDRRNTEWAGAISGPWAKGKL